MRTDSQSSAPLTQRKQYPRLSVNIAAIVRVLRVPMGGEGERVPGSPLLGGASHESEWLAKRKWGYANIPIGTNPRRRLQPFLLDCSQKPIHFLAN